MIWFTELPDSNIGYVPVTLNAIGLCILPDAQSNQHQLISRINRSALIFRALRSVCAHACWLRIVLDRRVMLRV